MHFSLSVSSVCHVATGKHKPKCPRFKIAVNTLPAHSKCFSGLKCPLYLKPYSQCICMNQCRHLSCPGIQTRPPLGQERSIVQTATIILHLYIHTRVGTLIGATIYLQLIQNRYMFRSFTVLQCSHQHCVQPVASDVEVVGHL